MFGSLSLSRWAVGHVLCLYAKALAMPKSPGVDGLGSLAKSKLFKTRKSHGKLFDSCCLLAMAVRDSEGQVGQRGVSLAMPQ